MTLANEINRMIKTILESSTWTSAGETRVDNFIKEFRGEENPDLEKIIQEIETKDTTQPPSFKSDKDPKSVTGISKNITKEDAQGVLKKAGINPKNIPNLVALSSGKGGLSLLTSLGGAAGLTTLLGPLALGLSIKPITEAIIKELQRPGGFLDKRVKIDSRNEAFAVLDRQTRQNTRIGDRQVIIQQFQGFRNFDGYASTNTSNLITQNANRVLDIGLFDRAQGISAGGT